MPSKTSSSKSSRKPSTKPRSASSSKPLPRLSQASLPDAEFNESSSRVSTDGLSTLWIIIFAFAILAVISVVVWAVLSGRSDGKIHGDNIEKIRASSLSEQDPE